MSRPESASVDTGAVEPSLVEHSAADLSGADHRALLRRAAVSHPNAVAAIVIALGWSVTNPDELVEYLQRIADLAVDVIGGADSAGVTANVRGTPFTAVHTDATTLDVDAHQYDAGDGPCLQAMRTRQVVEVDVRESREQWPRFTTDAEAAGIHSFLASPLGTTERAFGSLNLYGAGRDGFTPDDEVILRVLVAHASRALNEYTRLCAAQDLAAQLQDAMVGRAPIEQAKGILMAVHGIEADAAFDLLRTESQRTNVRLRQLAINFLASHTAPSVGGQASNTG